MLSIQTSWCKIQDCTQRLLARNFESWIRRPKMDRRFLGKSLQKSVSLGSHIWQLCRFVSTTPVKSSMFNAEASIQGVETWEYHILRLENITCSNLRIRKKQKQKAKIRYFARSPDARRGIPPDIRFIYIYIHNIYIYIFRYYIYISLSVLWHATWQPGIFSHIYILAFWHKFRHSIRRAPVSWRTCYRVTV